MNWRPVFLALRLCAAAACIADSPAEVIPIPNGSFEVPETTFVDINIDSWQKSAKPDWYSEAGGFLWTQLSGGFKNTPEGRDDHLDNCDGAQAAWLFAIPEAGLFQDYNSVDWDDGEPTHAFNARFSAGKSYELSVGLVGGGGGMSNGATVEISLYYRDASSNKVTVTAASITNSPSLFSNRTHFLRFQAHLPTVQPTDAWAGQHIGVQILSTVTTNLQGGYWDMDHVQLLSLAPPRLTSAVFANGQFTLTLQSEPGLRFEILASPQVGPADAIWSWLGNVTNTSGTVSFTDEAAGLTQRFYQARQLP